MSTSNYLKKMRNTHINDSGRASSGRVERSRGRNYSRIIDLNTVDKQRLKSAMSHELLYYNHLIDSFSAMSRTFPEKLLAVTDWQEKLFGKVAYTKFDINKIVNKKDGELPQELEPFRETLFGVDSQGKRKLTDALAMFLEKASERGDIHPQVRENMAIEMLRFYKEQARIRSQPVPKYMGEEQAFKSNPMELETVDSIRKRHVQIPKSICTIEYDDKNEESKIWTPYTTTPIIFPTINLQNEHWTIAIIHQEPGKIPGTDTPWTIDLKTPPVGYLIKYLDLSNPYAGSTFHAAKRRPFG